MIPILILLDLVFVQISSFHWNSPLTIIFLIELNSNQKIIELLSHCLPSYQHLVVCQRQRDQYMKLPSLTLLLEPDCESCSSNYFQLISRGIRDLIGMSWYWFVLYVSCPNKTQWDQDGRWPAVPPELDGNPLRSFVPSNACPSIKEISQLPSKPMGC